MATAAAKVEARASELTPRQRDILDALAYWQRPAGVTELARRCGVSKQAMSRHVDNLALKRLVRRSAGHLRNGDGVRPSVVYLIDHPDAPRACPVTPAQAFLREVDDFLASVKLWTVEDRQRVAALRGRIAEHVG